jgi:NAD(P) transhydrogenase subunit beta
MEWTIDITDLAVAFLFIYGLKQMSSPVTARKGIVLAGGGMLVAVLASMLYVFGVNDVFGVNAAAREHLTVNVSLSGVRAYEAELGFWLREGFGLIALTEERR